jgi:hypothetical protein
VRRLLVVVVLASLPAACGGGGDGRLSKQEYAKRADALCDKYAAELKGLGQPQSFQELARFTDKAAPLAQRLIDDTQKLRPPKDEQVLVDEWNAENQKIVDAIKALGAAARKNDQKAAKAALDAGDAANTKSNALGRRLGMSACTKD